MPPPTLTVRRQGPQTLLLTALALLIAIATIMLACGPEVQPIPNEGDTRPEAPQAEGGSEEPEEEPTATPPVAGKPAVGAMPAPGLDYSNATPTREIATVADTPTPEPSTTPTPEPAAPTDTPAPEVLAKAAVPAPEVPEKVAAQETENSESPEPTATPTPRPTLCFQQGDGEICINEPLPVPTPKYPVLGDFSRYAQEAEESQADASQVGGASGQTEVNVRKVFVRINLSSGASGEPMLAWLQSNGVPLTTDWPYGIENNLVEIYGYSFTAKSATGSIYAIVPASLLLPLSQQMGFAGIEDACLTFRCHGLYAHNTHRDAN